MVAADILLCHGSCVAINGQAVLLRGAPGSGKSDLVLRLLDGQGLSYESQKHRQVQLIADDQVELKKGQNHIIAQAPAPLSGLLEIRGLGIVKLTPAPPCPLVLVVDLMAYPQIERLPERAFTLIFNQKIPLIQLDPTLSGATSRLHAVLELQDRLISE